MSYLVGAFESELELTPSTTLGLYQLLSLFYRPTQERNKILINQTELVSAQSLIATLKLATDVLVFQKADAKDLNS